MSVLFLVGQTCFEGKSGGNPEKEGKNSGSFKVFVCLNIGIADAKIQL